MALRGSKEIPPKLTVELRDDQLRIRDLFEFGEQKQVFSKLIDTILESYDKMEKESGNGKMVIYAILSGDISILDLVRKG